MILNHFKKHQRLFFVITILIFLLYSGWILGPYLHSVFIRDAAVTAWTRVVTAPIAGQITSELPSVAAVIDDSGHIATIRNDRLFEEDVALAQLENQVHRTEVQVTELSTFADSLKGLKKRRDQKIARYANVFRSELDTRIKSLQTELSVIEDLINIVERELSRKQTLLQNNVGSKAALDEAELKKAELKLEKSKVETELAYTLFRYTAANKNVFLDEEGSDPPWAQVIDYEFDMLILQTQFDLNNAVIEHKEAEKSYAISKDDLELLREAIVSVPSGAVVQSIEVPEGATVSAGEILVRWADCSDLLVDVPVSDAELALIKPGMKAYVVIEGDRESREAQVLLTRGSTATLAQNDLAAVGKGRRAGIAQVIVQLPSSTLPENECLIGRAANVQFPNVGIIDIIRVRLRL